MTTKIREHPDVVLFQRSAARFCCLLEVAPEDRERWVDGVLAALSRLYADAHSVPYFDTHDATDFENLYDVHDERWQQVYSLVQSVLGDQAFYWCYFDPSEPLDASQREVTGDVADDLADIYRDIKPGLLAWDTKVDAYLPWIIFSWRATLFASHWGVHAVDAMRALHPLALLRGLRENNE